MIKLDKDIDEEERKAEMNQDATETNRMMKKVQERAGTEVLMSRNQRFTD